jgi:hypothetical protein
MCTHHLLRFLSFACTSGYLEVRSKRQMGANREGPPGYSPSHLEVQPYAPLGTIVCSIQVRPHLKVRARHWRPAAKGGAKAAEVPARKVPHGSVPSAVI